MNKKILYKKFNNENLGFISLSSLVGFCSLEVTAQTPKPLRME